MKFIGKQASFGLAIEGTRGTAETTADIYIQNTSLEMEDQLEKTVDESTAGMLVEGIGDVVSKTWSEGSIETKVGDSSFGYFIKGLLGGLTTTANGDGSHEHVFALSNTAQHPTFTLFKADPIQDYSYANGSLESLDLNIEVGNYAMVEASFKGKKGAEVSITPAYVAENSFLPKHTKVKIATDTAGLDSASGVCVQKASLSFAKNLVDEQCLGSQDVKDYYNTQVSVEGSLELYYDKKDHHDDLFADNKKAMRIEMENTDVSIGTGKHPKITIDFGHVKYQETPIKYDNGNLVTQTVSFKGYYNIADGSFINVTLTNINSSY